MKPKNSFGGWVVNSVIASMFAIFMFSTSSKASLLDDPQPHFITAYTSGLFGITVEGFSADFTDEVFFTRNGTVFGSFTNQGSTPGTVIDFGTISIGDKISVFGLVHNTGNVFFPGTDINPDGINHFISYFDSSGFHVGFEDLYGGGDFDFNDLSFLVNQGDGYANMAPIPEPSTYAMLIVGLLMVLYSVRKRSNKGYI